MTEPLDDARGELYEVLGAAMLAAGLHPNEAQTLAITDAIRPAPLPQCEAEPVAWQAMDKKGGIWRHCDHPHSNPDFEYRPLYAASARCDAETAVAAERERCAKIAVEFGAFPGERFIKEIRLMCGNAIADKIRETQVVSSAQYRCTCGAEPYCAPNVHAASCPLAISSTDRGGPA